jgi:chromosome segregation protein
VSAEQDAQFGTIKEPAAAFDAQHRQAVMLQESSKALYEEAQKILGDLQLARADARKSDERLVNLNAAPQQLQTARTALKTKRDVLVALLQEAAAKVEAMSGGWLRARVEGETVPKQQAEALFAMCDGNRIRDLQSKCEERARDLNDVGTAKTWDAFVDALMKARRFRVQTGAVSIEQSDRMGTVMTGALFGEMTHQQLNGVFAKIDDATIGRLLTATAEDYISFEYRDARRFIPFGQASPGQQAAALLQLLLSQEAGTLIIDQPEDDLDNRVIMDIAKLLQKTKRRRQLVFATHNPNFVVNGDADKIIAMLPGGHEAAQAAPQPPRVSISEDGAIETRAVRAAVTETMEGGEAAFALRSRKYSFSTA